MRVPLDLYRLAFVAVIAGALVAPNRGLAQEPDLPENPEASAEVAPEIPAPEIPAELQDPAFDQYVDLDFLTSACHSLDPAALADAGLQLAEGERVLFRSHKAVAAETVLRLAIKAAVERRDQRTLERLAKAANALGMRQLAQAASAAGKLASQPRASQPIEVDLNNVAAEEIELYRFATRRIANAAVRGDGAALEELAALVEDCNLAANIKTNLTKQLADAKKNVADGQSDTASAISKLAAASRGGPYIFVVVNQRSKTVKVTFKKFFEGSLVYARKYYVPPGGFAHLVYGGSHTLSIDLDNIKCKARHRLGGGSFVDRHYIEQGTWYIRSNSLKESRVYEKYTPSTP